MSKAEYLIAMRFHAIIVGLLTQAKILAINYDIKIDKIAKEFNLPMLDLKKDFKDQFKELKTQNPAQNSLKVNTKSFNWNGFDSVINN